MNTESHNEFTIDVADSNDSVNTAPVAVSRFKRKTDRDEESSPTIIENQPAFLASGVAGNIETKSLATLPDTIPDQIDLSHLGVLGTPEDRDSTEAGRSFTSSKLQPVLFTGGAEDTLHLHGEVDYVIIRIKLGPKSPNGSDNDVTYIDSETPGNYGSTKEEIGSASQVASFDPRSDRLIFVVEDHQPIAADEQNEFFNSLEWIASTPASQKVAGITQIKFVDTSSVAHGAGKTQQAILRVNVRQSQIGENRDQRAALIDAGKNIEDGFFSWAELTADGFFEDRLRIVSRSQLLLKTDTEFGGNILASYDGPGLTFQGTHKFNIVNEVGGTVQTDRLEIDLGTITDANKLTDSTQIYTWYRIDNGVASKIEGEASATYDVVDDDVGKTIRAVVHFTDDNDNLEIFFFDASTITLVTTTNPTPPQFTTPAEDSGYTDGFTISGFDETISDKTITVTDADTGDIIYPPTLRHVATKNVVTVQANEAETSLDGIYGKLTVSYDQAQNEISWRYRLTISEPRYVSLVGEDTEAFDIIVRDRSPDNPDGLTAGLRVHIIIVTPDDPPKFASAEFLGTLVTDLGSLSVSPSGTIDRSTSIPLGISTPALIDPDTSLSSTLDYRFTAVLDGTNISDRFKVAPTGSERTISLHPGPRIAGDVQFDLNVYASPLAETPFDSLSTVITFPGVRAPVIDLSPFTTLTGGIHVGNTQIIKGTLFVRDIEVSDQLRVTFQKLNADDTTSETSYGTITSDFEASVQSNILGFAIINWTYSLNDSFSSLSNLQATENFNVMVTNQVGGTATAKITISIDTSDPNPDAEDAPIFDATNTFIVTPNFDLPALSNQFGTAKIGLKAMAYDPDENETPVYTLVSALTIQGQDIASRFEIDSATGEISVIGGAMIEDIITFTVRAADATEDMLANEAEHILAFRTLHRTITGDDIYTGKTSLSGVLPFSSSSGQDLAFQVTTGKSREAVFRPGDDPIAKEIILITGDLGDLRLSESEDGYLEWHYTVFPSILFSIEDPEFTGEADPFTILVDGQRHDFTFTIAPLTSVLRDATPIEIAPISPEGESASDHKIKTVITRPVDKTTKQIIRGDDAADTIIAGNNGDVIDPGRGVDKVELTKTTEATDTIIYDFDASDPTGWVAVDGSDTYTGFQRGIDKLILRARTIDGKNPLEDPNRNSNIKVNGIRENINGDDMIAGITIQFAASGGGHGNIQAGNTLTIKFAVPITTEAFLTILPEPFYDSTKFKIIDVFASGRSIFDYLFSGTNGSGETALITDNFDIVALDPPNNSFATGIPTIINNNGELSLDLAAIADADGINENTYSYAWYKFDISAQNIIFLAATPTYILTEADIGDVIRATLTFVDWNIYSNAETLSTVSHHVIASDLAASNVAPTDFTNTDDVLFAHDDISLSVDIL